MDEELRMLFKKVDYSRSGYVNSDQIVRCLSILGYPATPERIELEFKDFDYDDDKKMDFKEFRKFMMNKMRSTVFKLDNMIDIIKSKLKKVHPTDGFSYDIMQFASGLASVTSELTPDEIQATFFEIDQDSSGTVTMDELVNFLRQPPNEYESPLVANAILKIKKTQMLPIKELISIYQDVPKNYCTAFTRLNFLQMKNLPSDAIYPKLMSNNLVYEDIFGEFYERTSGVTYPIKPLTSKMHKIITLDSSTGIPIPLEDKVNRKDQIKGRELRAVLFDRSIQKFVGGTVVMPAFWYPEYEDRWVFESPEKNCSFYVRADGNVDSLCVIFEFVLLIVHKNIELQMSCGWASIDLANLVKDGKEVLQVLGGAPNVSTQIHPEDILTGRSTFFGKVGKLFSSDIKSTLTIKVQQEKKISPSEKQMLNLLPRTILVPTHALRLWRAYRCYLGKHSTEGATSVNSSLGSDINVKSFLRCVNLSSLHRRICSVWNSNAE
jgi:Ca2+-binding EF-hand superfamily protein